MSFREVEKLLSVAAAHGLQEAQELLENILKSRNLPWMPAPMLFQLCLLLHPAALLCPCCVFPLGIWNINRRLHLLCAGPPQSGLWYVSKMEEKKSYRHLFQWDRGWVWFYPCFLSGHLWKGGREANSLQGYLDNRPTNTADQELPMLYIERVIHLSFTNN